ncbi:hypothetical protein ACFQX8_05730 [Klenkia terrae]|uniref:hypothetical protein n=1 Tax=Klenkia terrae TaxID=1052259 RepID=UPI003622A09B
MTREQLLARYRELVLGRLPARAREQRWVVTADHCFGRIVLDHAVGGRWYDVLDRRRSPPSRSWTTTGWPPRSPWPSGSTPRATLLRELDRQSLVWRGKPTKASTAPTA